MCMCIYIYIYIYIHIKYLHTLTYSGGLKSSYKDVIPAVDDIYEQWDPSTETQMEEVCRSQKELC